MAHLFPIVVFYEDTDFTGLVYHANYLKFIERGRSTAVNSIGVSQYRLKLENKFFVVTQLTAKFIRPAYFEDRLIVETKVIDIRRASFWLEQTIMKGSLKIFSAKIQLAMLSSGRPIPLSDLIRQKLGKLR